MKGTKDIKTIIDDFFRSDRLRPVLKSLVTREISGWEAWLQIEFAHSLTTHKNDPNWYREYELTSSDGNEKNRPDFWLWSKQDKKYVVIEFKQAVKSNHLIELMKKDVRKFFTHEMICASDKTAYEFSGQIFIGVFKDTDNFNLELTGCDLLGEAKIIDDTEYSYVIFSRSINKLVSMPL